MARLSAAVLLLAVPALAAAADPPRPPTFEGDVLPVLNAHCLQCHGGVHQRSGLDLRTLASALKGGTSGPAVVPGRPDDSPLWKKVAADEMPKTDNKVSPANKDVIRRWIAAGAKGAERPVAVDRPARPAAEVAKRIDAAVATRLADAKVPASPRSDDGEFLRRVFLDIAGRPPTADRAAAFLADTDPTKRGKLIDELLASPDYGRHLGERWVNVVYLTTANQSPKPPEPFKDLLAAQLNAGRGWDAVVRDILTARGPLADAPQGLFFYYSGDMNASVTPKIVAGTVGQVFLGVQLQCAECHDHPFADWKQTDFWGVAAFFAQTSRMETVENKNTPGIIDRNLDPKPGRAPPVLKDISVSIPNDGEARNGGKRVLAALLDGRKLAADPNQGHRPPLAAWLTARDNRMFARAAVNRFWAHFFGRGFVTPLADFGDHNPPSHPALLDELADEFVASGFDVRHLARAICRSDAYQRSSRVAPGNDRPEAEPLFARMTPKVLTPEQLYDSLCTALEVPEIAPPVDPRKRPNPKAPPPPSPRSVFAAFFRGPGEGDEPTELRLGVPHALKLMNDPHFNAGGKLVDRVSASTSAPAEAVDAIFVAVLSRKPTAAERARFVAFVDGRPSRREAYARVVWVLVNSSEFLVCN